MKRCNLFLLIFLAVGLCACDITVPEGVVSGKDYEVRIRYTLSRPAIVSVSVYNSFHTRVRLLLDRQAQNAGNHDIVWDKRNEQGRPVPDGVYYAKVEIDGQELLVWSFVIASSLR